MYIENVVVGKLLCPAKELFAINEDDWLASEIDKTHFTVERYLPRILVDCEIVKSTSEVKRNKPQLCITLDKVGFMEIKWGKRRLFVAVGE